MKKYYNWHPFGGFFLPLFRRVKLLSYFFVFHKSDYVWCILWVYSVLNFLSVSKFFCVASTSVKLYSPLFLNTANNNDKLKFTWIFHSSFSRHWVWFPRDTSVALLRVNKVLQFSSVLMLTKNQRKKSQTFQMEN